MKPTINICVRISQNQRQALLTLVGSCKLHFCLCLCVFYDIYKACGTKEKHINGIIG